MAEQPGSSSELVRRLLANNRRAIQRPSAHIRAGPPANVDPNVRAAVLTCSDLGHQPDALFDLAPGTLFVLQTPACWADAAEIEGIEFAIRRHQISAVLLLGHCPCTVLRAAALGGPFADRIGALLEGRALDPSTSAGARVLTSLNLVAVRRFIEQRLAARRTSIDVAPMICDEATGSVSEL